jgi:hypothetical protein
MTLVAPLVFACGVAIAVTPWSARNVMRFGDPALVVPGGLAALAQRTAYNRMNVGEWFAAWALWTPVIGTEVVPRVLKAQRATLEQHTDSRLELEARQALATASAQASPYAFLIQRSISEAGTHLLTSLPLLWRGLWGGTEWVGLAAAFLLLPFLRVQRHVGALAVLGLALAPLLGLCVVQSLISPNPWYMNLAMPVVFSYVLGYLLATL